MPISPNGWKEVYKDQDVTPTPRYSLRTKREMYLGSRSAMLLQASEKMPTEQYSALLNWVYAWLNQEIKDA